MDTKLKNMRRLKNSIIVLCILLPALILVALYPQMERAVLQYHKEIEDSFEEENDFRYELEHNSINYLVEASYYIYGQMYQEVTGTEVKFDVLREYGWIGDYYRVNEQTDYCAEFILNSAMLENFLNEEGIVEEKEIASNTEDAVEEKEIASNTEDAVEENEIASNTEDAVEENEIASNTETAAEENEIASEPSDRKDFVRKKNTGRDVESLLMETSDENRPTGLPDDMLGYVLLEYDTYGNLENIQYEFQDEICVFGEDFYKRAKESMDNYDNNMNYYMDVNGLSPEMKSEYMKLCPKNFRVVFGMYDTDFIYEIAPYYHYGSLEDSYLEIGALWIVIALVLFVALAAIVLPFIKQLQTGREKLFCIPFEITFGLIAGGITGAVGMFILMSYTNMYMLEMLAVEQPVNILGSTLSAWEMYWILLVLNFLGWAVLFFAEYVVVASLRQFFCGPKEYLKNRLLIMKFFRWIKKKLHKLYVYVTDIDINDRLIKSITKIVAVNFVILTVLCCLWFFGIAGLLVYSIVLFVVMRKYGEKVQQQYRSILQAARQMADGDLKIKMEENLGMFQPIGTELEKVQQGFAKAVAEEAKSQNMKTELITNVSHDLKTPLTAIITYVDLLKTEGITDEERNYYIATIDQKSQRLKVLIEDLFEVSKANSGNIQMHFMDVNVVSLMKQVRLEMEEKIAESELNFRWNLPDERIILSLDGARTYRIFENLLNNILKYSMPRTRVYIDILEQGEEVHIMFRNISAIELEGDGQNLTDRFVRGDASRNTEGSGLGLAIVKSFVEAQNGRLNIEVDGDLFKVVIIWKKSM